MDGRSTTFALALALAGTGLAGCIENPDWFNNTSAEVSARENLDLATDAALDWSSTAVLVGVMGFELSESPDPRIDADPDPGNGLAPAWWYVFCDSEDDSMLRAFKVTSDGTVTSEADAEAFAEGFDHEMAEALGAWNVDSNAALETAKGDAGFAKVAQGYNATVVEGIAHYEDATAWWVSAMSAEGFVVASVDAVTGELLHVESVSMDFEMPTFEWGAANPQFMAEPIHLEGEGSADPEGEPAAYPFWVDGMPMTGYLWLDSSGTAPGQSLWWEIVDAEGESVAHGSTGRMIGPFGSETTVESEVDIEPAKAQEYTLYIGSGGWMPMNPLAQPVKYAFTLDLFPPGMEHEHDEHEED